MDERRFRANSVRWGAFFVAVCAFAAPVHAQETQPASKPLQVMLLPSVQYGAPLKWSGGLAVFLPTAVEGGFRTRGYIVEGSVGQGGARGSFGFVSYLESFGLDGRAVVHRTRSSPRGASSNATYIGVEGGASFAYVRASVGIARRVSGASGSDATIPTWTAGVQIPIWVRR
jgi:hypothetical protein